MNAKYSKGDTLVSQKNPDIKGEITDVVKVKNNIQYIVKSDGKEKKFSEKVMEAQWELINTPVEPTVEEPTVEEPVTEEPKQEQEELPLEEVKPKEGGGIEQATAILGDELDKVKSSEPSGNRPSWVAKYNPEKKRTTKPKQPKVVYPLTEEDIKLDNIYVEKGQKSATMNHVHAEYIILGHTVYIHRAFGNFHNGRFVKIFVDDKQIQEPNVTPTHLLKALKVEGLKGQAIRERINSDLRNAFNEFIKDEIEEEDDEPISEEEYEQEMAAKEQEEEQK